MKVNTEELSKELDEMSKKLNEYKNVLSMVQNFPEPVCHHILDITTLRIMEVRKRLWEIRFILKPLKREDYIWD